MDFEKLAQKVIDLNRTYYDAMTPEQQDLFRRAAAAIMKTLHRLLEEERRETIDQILKIMDVVDPIEKSPFLRDSIIRFRDTCI